MEIIAEILPSNKQDLVENEVKKDLIKRMCMKRDKLIEKEN